MINSAARSRLALILCLLSLPAAGPLGADPTAPTITYPTSRDPVFGNITVTVELAGARPTLLRLRVDGVPAGKRSEPPWAFPVSLAQDNASHVFEVQVTSASGAIDTISVVTPAIQVDEVVDLSLRQIFVTVTDRKGGRVEGLQSGDFRVLDDDRLQKTVTFAGGEIPFSAILLIDGSESMRGTQIEAARAGARAFLSGMEEYDEAKVVVFSTRLLAASEFAGRDEPLSRLVESVVPDGGTAINDFMFLALRRLEERHGRRVLVLLSDGWDIHSVLRARQVEGIARQSQAQIYWLRLDEKPTTDLTFVDSWRDAKDNLTQLRSVERLIEESGGRTISVTVPSQIPAAFREVLEELRSQYALGYYPDTIHGDGRWRRLDVQVQGGHAVQHREGYLDLQ